MADSTRSSSYYSYSANNMQLQPYCGRPPPPSDTWGRGSDSNYQNAQRNNKLGKSASVSSSWALSDPEFQRKKRIARYKMYGVEGKVKVSLRKSFQWLKNAVLHGWW